MIVRTIESFKKLKSKDQQKQKQKNIAANCVNIQINLFHRERKFLFKR